MMNPPAAPSSPQPAVSHVSSHIRLWIMTVGVLWLDLWSKNRVFTSLKPGEVRPIFAGIVDFRRSLNDGAVFGLFTGYTVVFIIASLFALGVVFYMFAQSNRRQRLLHVALGLILAGALGNLYDRAFIKADVVQFTSPTGQTASMIGKIVGDSADPTLRVGDWPEGTNPRSFRRDEVEIHRQGVVRDFIKFVPRFPSWVPKLAGRETWPWVFNVADAALVCGVGILLLQVLLERNPRTVRD